MPVTEPSVGRGSNFSIVDLQNRDHPAGRAHAYSQFRIPIRPTPGRREIEQIPERPNQIHVSGVLAALGDKQQFRLIEVGHTAAAPDDDVQRRQLIAARRLAVGNRGCTCCERTIAAAGNAPRSRANSITRGIGALATMAKPARWLT